MKADYPAFRERNKRMPFGAFADVGDRGESAIQLTEEARESVYEAWWERGGLTFLSAFEDLLFDKDSNDTAAQFVEKKILALVKDPEMARRLTPSQVLGCKRLCADTNYFQTFNLDHVDLIDVNEDPIERFSPEGIHTQNASFELDAVVFATGFDAMTGALLGIDIRGVGGQPWAEKWAAGPKTYLGLMTSGFPNLFTVTGPGSPSVLSNMIPSIEQHVEWITDCIRELRAEGFASIDASAEAEAGWVSHVNETADLTLFPGCNSWYLGANVPGKPRVFMPYIGFPEYVEKCNEVVAQGYAGFERAK